MGRPTFGWITQLVARQGERIDRLNEDNSAFIRKLQGSFEVLWFDDHFQKDYSPTLECWTTLTYLAAQFPAYKVGSLVLCQSFRNPAMTAKMMSTLQVLTNGRYIAGIGAGWKEDEHLAYGYGPPPATRARMEQLEEAVQIIKTMWRESPATFHGKHYSIQGAECEPLPTPPPPLLIGGGGEKVTLRLVAKYADWMNITFIDAETYKRKLEVLQSHCSEVGRNFDEIKKSVWAYLAITKEGTPPPPISGDRYVIYGTPGSVRDSLAQFVDLGVEHFMLRFIDFPRPLGADLFLDEVLPHL